MRMRQIRPARYRVKLSSIKNALMFLITYMFGYFSGMLPSYWLLTSEGPMLSSAKNSIGSIKTQFETDFTFPTVEERVKYYMGTWYNKNLTVPTSPESSLCKNLFVASSKSTIVPQRDSLYTFTDLQKRHQMPQMWQSVYLKDAANILSHVESHIDQQGKDEEKYIILKTGDGYSPDHNKPVVAKTRRHYEIENEARDGNGEEVYDDKYIPIIWPIRLNYHFSGVEKLRSINQTDWDDKREEVVWRGACTGVEEGVHSSTGFPRLVFVEKHRFNKDKGIDVALKGRCRGISEKIQIKVDQSFYRGAIDMEKLLRYKYLLSLEGNDVSTGLKWMLASNSVVFMPPPTAVSFTMESKLVPYVHYVPVKRDGSDLLSQLEWAKKNDDKCKWISEQATAYIENLWSSDQAAFDLIVIKHMMGKMYHEKFSKALAVCHSGCQSDKVC
mmetsp:Transcript_31936/g.48163  ORF Transcript_31936/g.48163 Transcript_31936/m.48163 type:complete len:442 (+) Transcript_31936:84-1409(+)